MSAGLSLRFHSETISGSDVRCLRCIHRMKPQGMQEYFYSNMSCCSLFFFFFFLNKMKQLLFSTLGSVRSINIIYTVSTISHQQLSTSKEFCFRCIKMTPGIQTTLCYIRERWIIQTPTSPSFLITEYPRAGSNFLTFTYYLKISKTSGDSVMLFFFPFSC